MATPSNKTILGPEKEFLNLRENQLLDAIEKDLIEFEAKLSKLTNIGKIYSLLEFKNQSVSHQPPLKINLRKSLRFWSTLQAVSSNLKSSEMKKLLSWRNSAKSSQITNLLRSSLLKEGDF